MPRQPPDPAVERWVSERPKAQFHFTAVGESGLHCGVAILPASRRRDALASVFESIMREGFEVRIMPSDSDAVRECAAITRSRGIAIVTRNDLDFDDAGIDVIDPLTAVCGHE